MSSRRPDRRERRSAWVPSRSATCPAWKPSGSRDPDNLDAKAAKSATLDGRPDALRHNDHPLRSEKSRAASDHLNCGR